MPPSDWEPGRESCRAWIRTRLWGSKVPRATTTPLGNSSLWQPIRFLCRRSDSNRQGSCPPTVFETAASTIPPLRRAKAQIRTGDAWIFSPAHKADSLSNLSARLSMFLSSRRQGLSLQTIRFYHSHLGHARCVIGLDVKPEEIEQFIDNLTCSMAAGTPIIER